MPSKERRSVCGNAVDGTGRRWWRDTTFARRERHVELVPDGRWLFPPMPTQVSPNDRQALLALRRAVVAADPVQRVVALWEAIEFYVGDRSPEAQFTDTEGQRSLRPRPRRPDRFEGRARRQSAPQLAQLMADSRPV